MTRIMPLVVLLLLIFFNKSLSSSINGSSHVEGETRMLRDGPVSAREGYQLIEVSSTEKPRPSPGIFNPIKALQSPPQRQPPVTAPPTTTFTPTAKVTRQYYSPPTATPVTGPTPVLGPLGALGSGLGTVGNQIRVLAHPFRNLVMLSFEGYRRLIQDAHRVEDAIRVSLGLSKRMRFRSLDPLDMPEPVILEHRDKNTPVLGKVVLSLQNVMVSGLSNFKVEHLDGLGRNLHFQHLIPNLDTVANYTIDYHLFDAIPFRVSEGHLTANIPNARVKGSFHILPDILNAWFRVAQFNMSTHVDDIDLHLYPRYVINERFAIEKSTENKIHTAIQSLIPNITELLKITYTRAIELKLH